MTAKVSKVKQQGLCNPQQIFFPEFFLQYVGHPPFLLIYNSIMQKYGIMKNTAHPDILGIQAILTLFTCSVDLIIFFIITTPWLRTCLHDRIKKRQNAV